MRPLATWIAFLPLITAPALARAANFELTTHSYEIESSTDGLAKGAANGKDVRSVSEFTIVTTPTKNKNQIEAEIVRARLKVEGPRNVSENFDEAFKGQKLKIALKDGLPQDLLNKQEYADAVKKKSTAPMLQRYVDGIFQHEGNRVARNLMGLDLFRCVSKNAAQKSFTCTVNHEIEPIAAKCVQDGANGKAKCTATHEKDGTTSQFTGLVNTTGEPQTLEMTTKGAATREGAKGPITVNVEGKLTRKVKKK